MAIHLYQAACDLSDIQCAAALAYNGEKKDSSDSSNDNKGVAEDRAFSMNPFPGSTRAYPKSEIELLNALSSATPLLSLLLSLLSFFSPL